MNSDRIKIDDLKQILTGCGYNEYLRIKEGLKDDDRKNIRDLLSRQQKRFDKEKKELEAYNSRKRYELMLNKENYKYIAGIDEVGRGPLAGPVYTAAVILNPDIDILGVKDSKKLSEKQRETLAEEIKQKCLCYSIGTASVEEIEEMNISNATKLAMRRAIEGLSIVPDYLLIDAVQLTDINIPQSAIIKGDDLSISIGAASIVAKVERDRFMETIADRYPWYNFGQNKGYGTGEHIDAIKKHGPCEIHRGTFIKNFI